jgi:predicted permease
VLILAAAIAAATTTFSIVDAVVLRSLPFPNSDRLVAMKTAQPDFAYRAWQRQAESLDAIAASFVGPVVHVSAPSGVTYVRAWRVTASLFDVLGVRPILGRPFEAANEIAGQHRVAVISHKVWRDDFGSDPDIVGRSVWLGDMRAAERPVERVEIVGVMPRGFLYPPNASAAGVWIPLTPDSSDPRRNNASYEVSARLRTGRTMAEAQTELERIKASVATGLGVRLTERNRPILVSFYDALVGDVRSWMLLVLLAVTLVMLVACVNVAHLMLSRASTRARELAVRASLGASPRRLAAGVLVEALMVSTGAVALGVVGAWWGLDVAKAALPGGLPRADDIALDLRVLTAAAITAMAAGVFFGVVPAWQAARVHPHSLLNDGGVGTTSRSGHWRAALVSAEVALVSALLVVCTLCVMSFLRVVGTDLGFRHADLLVVQPQDPGSAIGGAVFGAIAGVPGVRSVAEFAGATPLIPGSSGSTRLSLEGGASIEATTYWVSPGYFETAGIRLLRGRLFQGADESSPVAVIDELAARLLTGDGRELIGIELPRSSGSPLTVVGVVNTVHLRGPEEPPGTQLYLPLSRLSPGGGARKLLVRTSGPAAAVMPLIRSALDRTLPAGTLGPEIRSFDDALVAMTAGRRANARLMFVFGIVVLLIGAAGVYAVTAAAVLERQREIGVRIVLGATGGRILRAVLGRTGAWLGGGVCAGFVAGYASSTLFTSLFFGVQPTDVSVYVSVAGILLGTGLIAAFFPAHAAARTDPVVALRER